MTMTVIGRRGAVRRTIAAFNAHAQMMNAGDVGFFDMNVQRALVMTENAHRFIANMGEFAGFSLKCREQ